MTAGAGMFLFDGLAGHDLGDQARRARCASGAGGLRQRDAVRGREQAPPAGGRRPPGRLHHRRRGRDPLRECLAFDAAPIYGFARSRRVRLPERDLLRDALLLDPGCQPSPGAPLARGAGRWERSRANAYRPPSACSTTSGRCNRPVRRRRGRRFRRIGSSTSASRTRCSRLASRRPRRCRGAGAGAGRRGRTRSTKLTAKAGLGPVAGALSTSGPGSCTVPGPTCCPGCCTPPARRFRAGPALPWLRGGRAAREVGLALGRAATSGARCPGGLEPASSYDRRAAHHRWCGHVHRDDEPSSAAAGRPRSSAQRPSEGHAVLRLRAHDRASPRRGRRRLRAFVDLGVLERAGGENRGEPVRVPPAISLSARESLLPRVVATRPRLGSVSSPA